MTAQPKQKRLLDPLILANELIQARYSFTALEIDIMCRVFKLANDSNYTQLELKLSSLVDTSSNNGRAQIKKAFKNLLSRPIELLDPAANCYTITNVISGVRVFDKSDKLLVNIDPFMVQYFCGLKEYFTMIELKSVLTMKSVYAKRIYLMACQFRATSLFNITLAELRKRLELGEKYKEFRDLKKRVIKPAIEEISKYSEFNIEISELSKNDRAIDGFSFVLKKKEAHVETETEKKQIHFMMKAGLADWQIENCYAQKTIEELAPILYVVFLRFCDKTKAHIDNKGAYLIKVLESNNINMKKAIPFNSQLSIPQE